MIGEAFSRTEMLFGKEGCERLKAARVAVFGLGGVGSFAAEALLRAGVGHFLIVDHDTVSISNINRQLHATMKTLGRKKAEVMRERMLSINPEAEILAKDAFYSRDNADEFFELPLDYIVDAVDTVTAKISLAEKAHEKKIPIISSMGAGNKLDPTRFETADIYETSVCPMARVMRKELRKRGIPGLKVVYSKEPPISPEASFNGAAGSGRKKTPGSVSFVPSVAGLIIAGEVARDIGRVSENGE